MVRGDRINQSWPFREQVPDRKDCTCIMPGPSSFLRRSSAGAFQAKEFCVTSQAKQLVSALNQHRLLDNPVYIRLVANTRFARPTPSRTLVVPLHCRENSLPYANTMNGGGTNDAAIGQMLSSTLARIISGVAVDHDPCHRRKPHGCFTKFR